MESHQPSLTRRFFKTMMTGFHRKLNLPPAICKKLGSCNPSSVILETCLGKWEIGLRKNKRNNFICLNQGWPEFVRRHSLSFADLVVFEPTAQPLHFKVYAFDSSNYEKELGDEASTATEVAPYFAKMMVPGYAAERAKLNIPTEFMRSNNLGIQHSVCLKDPRERTWMLILELANNGLRQRMSSGWRDFYESNGLKDEDTCIFTLIRPKTTSSTIFFEVTILRAA